MLRTSCSLKNLIYL